MHEWLGRGIGELADLHDAIEDLWLNIAVPKLLDRIQHDLGDLPHVHIPRLEVELDRGHVHVLRDQLLHLPHPVGDLDITAEALGQVEHLPSPLAEGGGDGHEAGVEGCCVVETVWIEEVQKRVNVPVEVGVG